MKSGRVDGILEHVTVQRSRCIDKDRAAEYLGTSIGTVERLINAGVLPIVKYPVQRTARGIDPTGESRRVLIDVRDLDELIERNKETRGASFFSKAVGR